MFTAAASGFAEPERINNSKLTALLEGGARNQISCMHGSPPDHAAPSRAAGHPALADAGYVGAQAPLAQADATLHLLLVVEVALALAQVRVRVLPLRRFLSRSHPRATTTRPSL
jgi:hypothetical protein